MKSAKTMTTVMALLLISAGTIKGLPEEKENSAYSEFQVMYSPELGLLANQLVSAYMMENPGVQIGLMQIEDPGLLGMLNDGSIALVNKDAIKALQKRTVFALELARDAIVPIMNSANLQRDRIREQGISPEEFAAIISGGGSMTWGELLGVSDTRSIHILIPDKICATNYLGDFLNMDKDWLEAMESVDPGELLNRIGNDPQALGFCSLADLIKLEKAGDAGDLELVAVDADGDNRIGTFEDIYASGTSLSHAIFVGRFPHSLYSRIYAVSSTLPSDEGEMAFMKWMLDEGQDIIAMTGMLQLGLGERNARMEELTNDKQAVASVPVNASPAGIFLLLGGLFILLGMLVYAVAKISAGRTVTSAACALMADGKLEAPGGLFFDKSHTWTFMEKNGMVRIGIDGFLQQLTGPLSRLMMKKPGEQIKKGENCLILIQDGKRLEIKSPVSGIVKEQNEDLLSDASWLNTEPYDRGWILLVEPHNWISELRSYLMGSSYQAWLKQEGARLKAFFTDQVKLEHNTCPEPLMQDGGEIQAGLLKFFGPEVWEEFQEEFINRTC